MGTELAQLLAGAISWAIDHWALIFALAFASILWSTLNAINTNLLIIIRNTGLSARSLDVTATHLGQISSDVSRIDPSIRR